MSASNGELRTRFDELKPGDRIEVEHTVMVDGKRRRDATCGTVVRTERRPHGPPCGVRPGERAFSEVILLALCDGELTAVTMEDSTVLRRA
jgi:hypothetical protein